MENRIVPVGFDVWKARWECLDSQMKAMAAFIDDLPSVETCGQAMRKTTLLTLIRCLRRFAAGQFNFFYRGFVTSHGLIEVPEYPLDFLFHCIIGQISYDMQAIQIAADHRRAACIQKQQGNGAMLAALATADCLAWDALQPAINAGWISQDTTVLTYFEKVSSIRIIPYANVALIGIPFSAICFKQDFLSIPHEIGHYVYRRGCSAGGTRLRSKFKTRIPEEPKYRFEWLEEAFADMYGCAVAGPVMALDFQDMQVEKEPDEFTKGDDHHATPIVRPRIYTRILHKKWNQAGNPGPMPWASELEKLWTQRVEKREQEQGRPLADRGTFQVDNNQRIEIAEAVSEGNKNDGKPLDRLADEFLALFPDNPPSPWDSASWWKYVRNNVPAAIAVQKVESEKVNGEAVSGEVKVVQQLLYDHYANRLNPVGTVPELDIDCDTSGLDGNQIARTNYISNLLIDWPQPFFSVDPVGNWWIDVFIAEGWNTYGNGRWIIP
ncbi:MAG: hypothetical protein JW934_10670 [Anaerolineae bacterium]|nr:hypothetical protein [Anaerolineae bacterium]